MATLMLFFMAHEMGHYLFCRRYGVYATLPFFIPMPTLIGTMGAVIMIRSRIRSRTALFDIGIARTHRRVRGGAGRADRVARLVEAGASWLRPGGV